MKSEAAAKDDIFSLLSEEEQERIENFLSRLQDGYVPTEEVMLRLDAMPELALQARITVNGTLKRLYEAEASYENLVKYTDSLYETADYLMHFEYWEEALGLLDECIELVRPLTEKGYDAHLLTTLYICHDRMGDTAVTAGDWTEAARQYHMVHDIIEHMADQDPRVEADQDYTVILDKLGYTAEMAEDYPEAEKWYRESLDIRLKFVKEGTPEVMRRVMEAQKNLGSLKQKMDSYPEAKALLKKAMTGAEMLWRDHKEASDAEAMVTCLDRLGIMAKDEEKFSEAETYYENAVKILGELMNEYGKDNPDWQRSLSRSYGKLADAFQMSAQYDRSEENLRKALDLSTKLLRKTGSQDEIKDLTMNHDRLGDLCGVTARTDEAMKEYDKSVKLMKKIKGGKDAVLQSNLFFTLKKMSIIERGRGNTLKARELGETALKACRTLNRMEDTPENRRFLADTYSDLGEIEEDAEKWSAARTWYGKALKINEKLYKEDPTVENKSEFSDSHDGLGYVAAALNDIDDAEKHFRICLTLNEELLEETGLVDEKRALAVTCRQLGLIAVSHKDIREAKKFLSRALGLQKDVMHESDDQEDRLTYGDIYEDVVNLPCETIALPRK